MNHRERIDPTLAAKPTEREGSARGADPARGESTSERKVTFCRICEAMCGLVAEVDKGRLVALRPDPDHPMSLGYACPKGIAMTDIQNDPDRVVHPLRRRPDGGGFERISWDTAITEIGTRLRAVRRRTGGSSIGWYAGVASVASFGHFNWSNGFVAALGSQHFYTASSQDVSSRFVANVLLYGSALKLPIPDLARTEFLLILGANPLVSNGSALTAPRIRDRLRVITKRGGRIVVLDPRRTETARAYEWVAVHPDSDAWLLLSMLQVIFAEQREDAEFLRRHVTGVTQLRDAVAEFTPEHTADRTGVTPSIVRALARDFADAPSAAAYGRTGACRGRFPTLVNVLLDALNVVTGNLDRPGGSIFAESAFPFAEVARASGADGYGRDHTRIGDLPEAGGMPSNVLAKEITTPGPGQLRALFVSAGNPVSTVPDSDELEAALGELELLVSIDLYVNDTNRHADYVLPGTTWLERTEGQTLHNYAWATPFTQYAEAAVAPYGEAREEWRIIEAISAEIDIIPQASPAARALGRIGLRLSPTTVVDLVLRLGPYGDRFGLRRRGLSLKRLQRDHPHGIRFLEHHPTGNLAAHIRHRDRRVHLFPPPIEDEVARLRRTPVATTSEYPLLLVSLRELRSHNSWTHNSPRLMRNRTFALRVHPDDAEAAGLVDHQRALLTSATATLDVPIRITDEMTPGTVSLPWGWGHHGGWRTANTSGGANLNRLTSTRLEDIEKLSGSTWLNGIPVHLQPSPATDTP